jgi:hypothetical protein
MLDQQTSAKVRNHAANIVAAISLRGNWVQESDGNSCSEQSLVPFWSANLAF